MIYPIVAYGDPILRQKAASLKQGTDVDKLVADMFDTMDKADGCGLAAPQIGQSIRLFIVDLSPFIKNGPDVGTHRKVYINPILHLENTSELEYAEEGCLSIPLIIVNVPRYQRLVVDYFDIHWKPQQDVLESMPARVIQHEYDHLEGKLHIDYADSAYAQSWAQNLADISQGKIEVGYPMRFLNKK